MSKPTLDYRPRPPGPMLWEIPTGRRLLAWTAGSLVGAYSLGALLATFDVFATVFSLRAVLTCGTAVLFFAGGLASPIVVLLENRFGPRTLFGLGMFCTMLVAGLGILLLHALNGA